MTSSPERTFQSCEARLTLDDATSALLWELTRSWSTAMREVYVRSVVGADPWFVKGSDSGLRTELIARGWTQREATSMLRCAQAAQSSAVEAAKLQVSDLEERIRDLNARLHTTPIPHSTRPRPAARHPQQPAPAARAGDPRGRDPGPLRRPEARTRRE